MQVNSLHELQRNCDLVSLHVHVTDETKNMINKEFFEGSPGLLSVINTSRGEVVDEQDVISHIENNPRFIYATDVLAEESLGHEKNLIARRFREGSTNIIVTPHIAGMTLEGREIAYRHAARMLLEYVLDV